MIISLNPTKNIKTCDIRGYMTPSQMETATALQTNPPPVQKRTISDITTQSTLDSFIISSHSLSTFPQNNSQPHQKKHQSHRLNQPTLFNSFFIDSQINSMPHTKIPKNTVKRTHPASTDITARFKRRLLTPPVSTSKKRTAPIVAHARFKNVD